MPNSMEKLGQDLIVEPEAGDAGHRLAMQNLSEHEAWGHIILDSLPVGVVLIDPETHRIVDANIGAAEMIGLSKEQLLGQICRKYVCQAKEGECPVLDLGWQLKNYERVLTKSNGETIPIHKTVTSVILGGKKFLLESFVDISEQKKTQKALDLDEVRFEALYNLSQMINEPEQVILDYALEAGVRVTDSKIGYIYFVNKEETELTLHAWSKEVMSQCSVQSYPDIFKVSETGLWGEAVRQRRPIITNDYETSPWRRGCPEGHVPVKRHMNLPVTNDGEIVLLAGVGNKEAEYTQQDVRQLFLIMDGVWRILQRKRDEAALKKALADAQQIRAEIEVILRSVADGLIFTDMENRIILMSASAEVMLGSSLEDVFLMPISAAIEDRSLVEQLVAVQSGIEEEVLIEWELPGGKQGEVRTIQAKPAVVKDDNGVETGVITLLRDVSRERHLDRMKSEFIATAAHELRTPLTSVLGFSDLLVKKKDLDEFQRTEYLSIIHKKSEVLGKIVDDLLDLARVDSGKLIRLKRDWADIGSIIRRCTADYQRACPDHHFETVLPEKPVVAFVDDRKLFQVMENLLGNAAKFSPAGSLIRVACEVSGSGIRVSVSDEGIGMSAEQAARAFDKFYRVDSSNTAKEGLGLGMAIVKSIIEAHGCRIWVESEVGKGTKVIFTLPGEKNGPR